MDQELVRQGFLLANRYGEDMTLTEGHIFDAAVFIINQTTKK